MSSGKFGGDRKTCVVCKKTVYPQERVDGLDSDIHQVCFYCPFENCKLKLSKNNYAAYEGIYYCQNHFKVIAVHNNPLDKKEKVSSDVVNGVELKPSHKADLEKLLEFQTRGIITSEEFSKFQSLILDQGL